MVLTSEYGATRRYVGVLGAHTGVSFKLRASLYQHETLKPNSHLAGTSPTAGAIGLCARYTMSGTDILYRAISLRVLCGVQY